MTKSARHGRTSHDAQSEPARRTYLLGKLKPLSGQEVCRILAAYGFVQVRRRGSHVIVQREEAGDTVTVPVPDHSELRVGTLMAIIRQSGVPRSAFE